MRFPWLNLPKAIGWHVTVVDRRPAYATRDRFPMADEIKIIRPETGLEALSLDARTAVVIMTHNYFDDRGTAQNSPACLHCLLRVARPETAHPTIAGGFGVRGISDSFQPPPLLYPYGTRHWSRNAGSDRPGDRG